MVQVRRTSRITALVRRRFLEELAAGRFTWGGTVELICSETGLEGWQVRDCIWSENADGWRRSQPAVMALR